MNKQELRNEFDRLHAIALATDAQLKPVQEELKNASNRLYEAQEEFIEMPKSEQYALGDKVDKLEKQVRELTRKASREHMAALKMFHEWEAAE